MITKTRLSEVFATLKASFWDKKPRTKTRSFRPAQFFINCDKCSGECCKRIAIPIDKPETIDDYEDLKWYLYHTGLTVYVDNEDDWLVHVPIACKHLKNGKCVIYDKRPPICRNSAVKDCEMNIKEVKFELKTPEDVDKYIKNL